MQTLKGFGVQEIPQGTIAAGAILHYLSDTHHHHLKHIVTLQRIVSDDYVTMDAFTVRNLELYSRNNPNSICLLDIIDKTLSAMGGRMLKNWLCFPLKDLQSIQKRQKIVQGLIDYPLIFETFAHQTKQIDDIERLTSRLATKKIYPRALVTLKNSLIAIKTIKEKIEQTNCDKALKELSQSFLNCDEVINKIQESLVEEAPVHINKGNAIAKGVSKELDEFRNILKSGKNYLDNLLREKIKQTGINSLKIAFNNVFGYYIEVKNTYKSRVPEDWIRKQTLVSAERYITEELKEYENKILGAEQKIQQLEADIYNELLEYLQKYISPMQANAQTLAELDCLYSFAKIAMENHYTCPKMEESSDLEIKQGRHPVIEKQLPIGERYIPNDVLLNRKTQQIIMITGPNMSGKSAILRQTALIVLLAQMGCYVPATHAKLGLVDKIFTRVGASDNISMGESTFMVEMNETASILNNVSERSLILLDEIGRGTSTYDGISIAWAIAKYLHQHPTKAKTLFATHYHELNEMAERYERIQNYNVSVKETKDNVVFLRKLVAGGSEHSFGIHVAKIAGMPVKVVHWAEEILKTLEQKTTPASQKNIDTDNKMQLSFFQLDDPLLESIKKEILNTEIDHLTPLEALMKLNQIKKLLTQ